MAKSEINLYFFREREQRICLASPITYGPTLTQCLKTSVRTTRNLHSHLHEAPLTKKHLQVTGYGIVSTVVSFCVY